MAASLLVTVKRGQRILALAELPLDTRRDIAGRDNRMLLQFFRMLGHAVPGEVLGRSTQHAAHPADA
jgi:hypothetical protein